MTTILNTLAEVQRLCIWRKGHKLKHIDDDGLKSQGWSKVLDNGDGFRIFHARDENNDWYLVVDNDTQSIYELRKQIYHEYQ